MRNRVPTGLLFFKTFTVRFDSWVSWEEFRDTQSAGIFKSYQSLPHTTIVKGDGKYLSIAAASILAKTYRDDYMDKLAEEYPQYDWLSNKGYPTKKHREAIRQYGITPYHRKTFNMLGDGQLSLEFE